MDRLERLRGFRVWPGRGGSIEGEVEALRRSVKKLSAAADSAARAWAVVVPDEFVNDSSVLDLKRGVLRVRVPDRGVRYRLDGWLRGGGESAVIEAAKAPVSRIKLV